MHEEIETGKNSVNQGEICAWKQEVMDNCRLWLADFPAAEEIAPVEDEEPDLYSFFEQLCVLRNEFRKNSRRSHDLFTRFGEHLDEFQRVLGALMQKTDRLIREDGSEARAKQGLLLQMVELYERLRVFGGKLAESGAPGAQSSGLLEKFRFVFGNKRETADAVVPVSIRDGFSLILSHFESFLATEGVYRIPAVGEPFDPSIMMAVGVVETTDLPPDIVCEEISGGYQYNNLILKVAKVTVSKRKEE